MDFDTPKQPTPEERELARKENFNGKIYEKFNSHEQHAVEIMAELNHLRSMISKGNVSEIKDQIAPTISVISGYLEGMIGEAHDGKNSEEYKSAKDKGVNLESMGRLR